MERFVVIDANGNPVLNGVTPLFANFKDEKAYTEAMKRLLEYEKSGLLPEEISCAVVLPCKIGDTVYDGDGTTYQVTGYQEGVCEPLTIICVSISDGSEGEIVEFEADVFGDTVLVAEVAVAESELSSKMVGKTERRCRVCGCTQNNACPGGCYWVEWDLCSRCAGEAGAGSGASV
jgi:hypothetical protein